MVKQLIRKWLGLDEDHREIIKSLDVALQSIRTDMTIMRFTVTLGADGFDPKRQQASKMIGERMITRMKAEDLARRTTVGEDVSSEAAELRRKLLK